jgi:hypothetical protein
VGTLRVGLKTGLRVGLKVGINNYGDGWNVDNGVALPLNAAQWDLFIARNSLSVARPTNLWLCQETSGNLADSIGSATLTASASPLYQQTMPGYTRKAVGFNETTNQRFGNASFANSASVSLTLLIIYRPTAIPAANAGICTYGTSNIQRGITHLTTDRVRDRNSGSISDFTAAMSGNGYLGMTQNVTASSAATYNQAQRLAPTYAADAGTRLDLGATTGTSAPMLVPYMAAWSGAAGEISTTNFKALVLAMGLPAPWAP